MYMHIIHLRIALHIKANIYFYHIQKFMLNAQTSSINTVFYTKYFMSEKKQYN